MTCFLTGLDDESHVHFVDGDNGGYAIAAAQLKDRLKTAALRKAS